MLSEDLIKAYLENDCDCLYCGSPNIAVGSLEFPEQRILQPVECRDCGRHWIDVYTLTGIIEEEEDG